MVNEITIPALPCASIAKTVKFYVALGFEITYQQERPSGYACVKHEDIELHFFSMKGYEPANSYSTCLVLVTDADALHQQFKAGLKADLGKVPVTGIPRLTRPSNNNSSGDWRFNVVDPGGNWVRFIQQGSSKEASETSTVQSSRFSRAIKAAQILVDAKGDFSQAAIVLDKALADDKADFSAIEHVRILVLRAEVALNLNDEAVAAKLLKHVSEIALSNEEQVTLTETLERAAEISEMLNE